MTGDATDAAVPGRLDLRSHDIAADKVQELLRLFPEARAEGGKLDFERLKLVLGEVVDVGKERFGLTWPGKADCFRAIQAPSLGTLRPRPQESVNWNETDHLVIQGDNLEVLKLLQKSYLGKVKMIYIDPPYNTGNDFIYPDNFAESLSTYLEYTGQADAEGRKFATNTDTDGRFHSKWLNMMFPRLYLARNLLRDDGVIFISIDDHEVDNLMKLCNEIFGEDAFLANLVWQSRTSISNDQEVSLNHNYTLCYAKRRELVGFSGRPLDKGEYANPDHDPRGPWKLVPIDANKEGGNTRYPIRNPNNGREYRPPGNRSWAINPEDFQRLLDDKRILFGIRGDSAPKRKLFLAERLEKGDTKTPSSLLLDVGTTQDGTQTIMDLFDGAKLIQYPKPVGLLRRLCEYGADKDSIVLDFFAGSGTTAQAILELNNRDGGRRKFILVQLPEKCPAGSEAAQAGYQTIAEVTKERVRRVIKKLHEADDGRLPLGSEEDRGFRVFELAESNFQSWNAEVAHDVQAVTQQLEMHIGHIRDGRTEDDITSEILLKSGYAPSSRVVKTIIGDASVSSVADGALLICLDRHLTLDVIRALAKQGPERVVCLDEGFAQDDQLKANAAQVFRTRGIVFKTV